MIVLYNMMFRCTDLQSGNAALLTVSRHSPIWLALDIALVFTELFSVVINLESQKEM